MDLSAFDPDGAALPRRDFFRHSCGLFTVAVLAANGVALSACDTASAGDTSTNLTGVSFDGSTLTVDLAQATALAAVGSGLVVHDARTLVVHAAEGDYRAFNSVCPHERNTISQVVPAGGTYELRCPSHGWTYDLDGDPTGRAQRGTARYALVQNGQTLTITVA